LGFAALLLTIAWQTGVQPAIDAAHYGRFTARSQGTIAESWIALDVDTASEAPFWRLRAQGTPCMTVDITGDWGAPFQRAFCGAHFPVANALSLQRPGDLVAGAPFAWRRDRRGFAVPEIRLEKVARDWLVTKSPQDLPAPVDPARNAYEELRLLLDEPVEQAVAGWSMPAPSLALALDPQHPEDAVPAAFADAKRHGESQPSAAIFATLLGLLLWFVGMTTLMRGLPRAPMLFAAIVPLLALPWWGEQVPLALGRLDSHVAFFIASILDGFENTQRLRATAPADAQFAAAERIVWSLDDSAYAKSLGSMEFAPPDPPPRDADAALAALEHTVATQVRALDPTARRALFDRLQQDKRADRRGAGLAFIEAAREAMQDGNDAESARAFLDEWTTPPIDLPRPEDAAFDERVRLYQSLARVADDVIAQGGRAIAEQALAERASAVPSDTK
jgi:hypothetical protein